MRRRIGWAVSIRDEQIEDRLDTPDGRRGPTTYPAGPEAARRERRRSGRATERPAQPARVHDAHREVTELLSDNRERLDALATALLEHETLDATDAYVAAGLAPPEQGDDRRKSANSDKHGLQEQ